jgi:hypothetical protein
MVAVVINAIALRKNLNVVPYERTNGNSFTFGSYKDDFVIHVYVIVVAQHARQHQFRTITDGTHLRWSSWQLADTRYRSILQHYALVAYKQLF